MVLKEQARAALRDLARSLRAIDQNYRGEMRAEAREVALLAVMPLDRPEQVCAALGKIGAVEAFVANWAECVRPNRTPKSNLLTEVRSILWLLEREKDQAPEDRLLCVEDADYLRIVASLHLLADKEQDRADREEERLDREVLTPLREASAAALNAVCALADSITGGS